MTVGLALIRAVGKHMYLTGRLTHIDRDSDFVGSTLDYDRTIATVGATWYF